MLTKVKENSFDLTCFQVHWQHTLKQCDTTLQFSHSLSDSDRDIFDLKYLFKFSFFNFDNISHRCKNYNYIHVVTRSATSNKIVFPNLDVILKTDRINILKNVMFVKSTSSGRNFKCFNSSTNCDSLWVI